MTLPQETIDKINAVSIAKYPCTVILKEHIENVERYRIGYQAGATEWAEKAQPVIDALQELVNLKIIKDQFGKTDEYLNNQPLAWEAAATALAKYKEVSNGNSI